ncbi:hypothetical protein K470DRAFT_167054 [Piedraia hortae CBS 480.64]|uniref:Myb-like domain-containing protein n=1 Tax=Piedraia hortae CBS 480.64 TaxID=1314780 RepID=A0A6A7C5C6_9PEZI|nr:hypothetical protein K470DRAFT_167054 [Piedraia hortae CBS 480.64]
MADSAEYPKGLADFTLKDVFSPGCHSPKEELGKSPKKKLGKFQYGIRKDHKGRSVMIRYRDSPEEVVEEDQHAIGEETVVAPMQKNMHTASPSKQVSTPCRNGSTVTHQRPAPSKGGLSPFKQRAASSRYEAMELEKKWASPRSESAYSKHRAAPSRGESICSEKLTPFKGEPSLSKCKSASIRSDSTCSQPRSASSIQSFKSESTVKPRPSSFKPRSMSSSASSGSESTFKHMSTPSKWPTTTPPSGYMPTHHWSHHTRSCTSTSAYQSTTQTASSGRPRFTLSEVQDITEDAMFSLQELHTMVCLVETNPGLTWRQIAARFYDLTGRRVHADEIKVKFESLSFR